MAFLYILLLSMLAFTGKTVAGRPGLRIDSWLLPHETTPAEQADKAATGVSPVPTNSPNLAFGRMPELKRDVSIGAETCGFVYGTDVAYEGPITCEEGQTCTNSATFRACCPSNGCRLSFWTECRDSTAAACTSDGGPGLGTFCCTSTRYPYCITFLWSTDSTPGSVFTLFNCGEKTWAGTRMLQAEPSASTTSPPTTTTIYYTTTVSTKKSTPVGAIVGGVVGGLAVIGLAAVGIVYMLSRNRRKKADPSNNVTEVQQQPVVASSKPTAQVSAAPSYHSGSPGIQAYNHHHSLSAASGTWQPAAGSTGFPNTSPTGTNPMGTNPPPLGGNQALNLGGVYRSGEGSPQYGTELQTQNLPHHNA